MWDNYLRGAQFRFHPEENIKHRYSITSDILSFDMCPKQYKLFKNDGFIPSLTMSMFFGTAIHDVLDQLYKHYQGKYNPDNRGEIPGNDKIAEYFTNTVNALALRHIHANQHVKNVALNLVNRFVQLEGQALFPRIKETECYLSIDKGPYILHGRVDVIARSTNPNQVEIWDYKSEKCPRPKEGPRFESLIYQMMVYGELYRQKKGALPDKAVLYFLGELDGPTPPTTRPVDAILELDFSDDRIQKAMAKFDATVAQIEECKQTKNWPDPQIDPGQRMCDECDIRWNCTATQQKYTIVP